MAENLVTPEKSIDENDMIRQLTYKELQQLAMSIKLPANLKHASLVALVKAHQCEDFNEVDRIVSEHRQLRGRGRLSRTTSTSPVAESLTLSPPISPEHLLPMPAPLASSSPKIGNHPIIANESLLQVKNYQTDDCTEGKTIPLETAVQLLCKETLQPHEERELFGSSGTLSSDRSPDPLELKSPSTYCSDSRTNSALSDIDPLVNVKESLDFPDKETLAKNLTELKPVPPSDLIDLSLSEPLLDSSLLLRPTFGTDSLQPPFLHPVHTLTQALMRYPSVQEGMINSNPLVNLCALDSNIDGLVNSSVAENKIVESTPAVRGHSDAIPLENVNARETSIVNQQPNSQKRQSIESDCSPCKLQKRSILDNVQQRQVSVSTVTSGPSQMPLVSRVEFPKLPSSLSIVPVPSPISATLTTSGFNATQSPMMPAPVIITTSSILEGEKVEPSVLITSTPSGNTSNWSTKPNTRKSIVHFSTSPVTSSITNLPACSSKTSSSESWLGPLPRPNIQISEYQRKVLPNLPACSSKTSSSESWLGPLPRPNIQISESQRKALPTVPKRAPGRSVILLSRGSTNKASTPNKKTNTAKSSQEIGYLSPDIAHVQFRSMGAKSVASPVKKSVANPIHSVSGNTPCYARQTIRPPSQHPTTAVTTSTTSVNAPRNLDQPLAAAALPSNAAFAMPTLPTRNPPSIATPIPRPARPESVVNFHQPPFSQPNLPSFNHLFRDPADNQKCSQSRQPEVYAPLPAGHGDAILPCLVQPRIDVGTLPLPQLLPPTRHPQMDLTPAQNTLVQNTPVQSPFVGQTSAAVGQNLSQDGCCSTLRHLLEAPVYNGLPNRDTGRRNSFNPYQFDSQNNNPFIKPQPSDHYRHMTGIGQTGNYPLEMQNFQRMPFMVMKPPESTERLLKTREFLADQRLGSSDLPKSLEPILNYRNEALSEVSTTSMILMGIGSHQAIDRHRSPQDFVPYSSNYPTEQHCLDMYGPSPLNAAAMLNQQPACEPPPSWFANEPCLPAGLPVNQYWPQAVNQQQPAMRLPQPSFRAVNPRNMPNHYYSPLKPIQMPNAPAFFNQPPINNVGYQGGMQQQSPLAPQPLLPQPPTLPDVQSYQPPESFDKVLPLQENMGQLVGQDPLAVPNQAMNQCPNQIHQDVPDFQGRGDQLSLSMIYNYLASAEHQVAASTPRPDHFDNQPQINQRPVYSRPIFPGTIGGQYQQQFGNGSGANSTPPQLSPVVVSASTSRSKHTNAPAKNVARRQEVSESTTLTREAATLSVLTLRKQSKERQKCVNFDNGCTLILPLSQLAAHEECCEYINLKCPKETCEWNGRARKLANHVREAHRAEINSGTDSKHSLPDIEALERVCFLQEVSRKLFAICVNCLGGVLYVSIQYIASGRSERPTSACGCIEVLGHDGHPHSWRGKLLPYYQSVETLLTTSSCLEVSLSTLGAFPGSTITLHVNIRVYSGNTNSNAQPSH